MLVAILIFCTGTAFFLGRYNGQRNSEIINDRNIKLLVGLCDTIVQCNWLDVKQKTLLADALINTLPLKDQKFIREQTGYLMKSMGF